MNLSGKTYLSHTTLNNQYVLRLAVGNLGTTREDVLLAWNLIQQAIPAG